MTALDLGAATRTLTPPAAPFSSIAYGDVSLVPWSGSVTPTAWNGIPALAATASWSPDNTLSSDAPFAIPQDAAIFVAIGGLATGSSNWEVLWHYSGFDLGINDEYLVYSSGGNGASGGASVLLPTPIQPTDLVVWCITSNSVELRVLNSLDGTLQLVSSPQASSPSDTFDVYLNGADANVLGVWQFDGVVVNETDAVDTMAAIIAALEASAAPEPVAASGDGGWGITAPTATVTVGDTDELPPLPTLTSGGAVEPPTPPTPAPPEELAPFGVVPIRHVWERMPAPTLDAYGNPVDWTPEASGDDVYGTYQYVVEGTDVTVLFGTATPEPLRTRGEPFGPQAATFSFPQFTAFHTLPSWARAGANVSIRVRKSSDAAVESLWEGIVVSVSDRRPKASLTLECVGVLMAADLQLRTPATTTAPQDVGKFLAYVLNRVPSRRYNYTTPVVTGIRTSASGGWEPLLTGFAARLLATAVKGGRQWTIACAVRTPAVVQKDLTTIAWEVRAGQRGIDIDLVKDATGAPNAIFGEGVNPRGGRWRGMVYPNWRDDTTPPYPFDPPSQSIRLGTRDSDTTTGDGVSRAQDKMNRPVTGVFSRGDVRELRRRQRAGGITVDGLLGPQSWAMLFQVGANSGSLAGAFPLPLAASPLVMPRLYGPDGDDLGPNPEFDPSILRVDEKVAYGQGVEKARAIDDAEERLAILGEPGWAGTIRFRIDPESMPKMLLKEGQNGRILDWQGEDLTVHTAHVSHSAGTATVQVDERGRDYPALQALLERDREAIDPAKAAVRRLLHGDVGSDRAEYDAESPGGRIVKHAVYGGLWTIARVPIGDYGTVARTVLRTTAPARTFAFAVFGRPVTANALATHVGNPLTVEANPWEDDTLDTDLGLLMAWGWKNQPCGYFPKSFSNPGGETGAPITGRFEDDAAWQFACENGQDLYVATFASGSCFIEGRLYGRSE